MTVISKKFEVIINKQLSKFILPVKTDRGIILGDVLITSNGTLKTIWKNDRIRYDNIYLNSVAIQIAKLLLNKDQSYKADNLYTLDQEYGKWLNDSLLLKSQYERAKQSEQTDKADILWARYIESRERTIHAKIRVDTLAR